VASTAGRSVSRRLADAAAASAAAAFGGAAARLLLVLSYIQMGDKNLIIIN